MLQRHQSTAGRSSPGGRPGRGREFPKETTPGRFQRRGEWVATLLKGLSYVDF